MGMTTPAKLNELNHAEEPARGLLEGWGGSTFRVNCWRGGRL